MLGGRKGEIVNLKKSASKITFTAGKFFLYNLFRFISNKTKKAENV